MQVFIAAYANDVMIYPNPFIIYTGFALCITATNIDPVMQKEDDEMNREKKKLIINEIKMDPIYHKNKHS